MDEKIIEVLKELVDLCARLEEGVRRFRERVVSLVLESIQWKTLTAPAPLNPEDKALKWLEKRLSQVLEKHPETKVQWVRDEEGRIRGLKYHASDEEVEGDILGPVKWAFEKASSRPVSGNRS